MDCCRYDSPNERCWIHPAFTLSYRTIRLIGQGAYGTVYSSVHRRTNLRYAVKVISLDNVPSPDFVNIASEERIICQLDHPHIVRFHESIWGPRSVYLVFEFLRGGHLRSDIQRKRYYCEFDASSCMEQVLSAIEYCHSKNIIHRDLKLENIVLILRISVIYVKIIDFGLAVQSATVIPPLLCRGYSEFTAPEVMGHHPHWKPVDMWACGVVLYKLLVGLQPLPGTIYCGRRRRVPGKWNDLTIAAKDLIERMLQLPEDSRITVKDALQHEFIVGRDSGSSDIITSSSTHTSSSND